jgi:tol-pal system-associated acyl-CoA thioesterase
LTRISHAERVYWSDVDKMDVVYYGTYLRFIERTEAAFFRELGYGMERIGELYGVWLARVHAEMDFRKPARLDDELLTWIELRKIGGSSLHFTFGIERAGERIVDAKLVLAALDRETLRAKRLPAAFVAELEPFVAIEEQPA